MKNLKVFIITLIIVISTLIPQNALARENISNCRVSIRDNVTYATVDIKFDMYRVRAITVYSTAYIDGHLTFRESTGAYFGGTNGYTAPFKLTVFPKVNIDTVNFIIYNYIVIRDHKDRIIRYNCTQAAKLG